MRFGNPVLADNGRLRQLIKCFMLSLLGSDDAFRALFAESPYSALLQAGHQPADTTDDAALQQAGKCLYVRNLASKEGIKASRSALERQFNAPIGMSPIHLNIDGFAERRLRPARA